MRGQLLGRLPVAQTTVFLVTLAGLALLSVVLAYWTWVWFAPRAEPRAQAEPVQSGSLASAAAMFGTARPEQKTAVPTGIAIRLLGVVAASHNRLGYAVVQLEAKRILAVLEGEEIGPGIRLAEVHPDHVILERSGMRETLAWPKRRTTAAPAAPTREAPGARTRQVPAARTRNME
jgi:general secretion pathway protein C